MGRIGVVWRLRAKSAVSRARLGGSSTRRSAARRADATVDDVRRVGDTASFAVRQRIGVVSSIGIDIDIDVDVVYLSSSVAAMLQVQGNFGRRATDGGRRMRRQK